MLRKFLLTAAVLSAATAAQASQPGEDKTPPSAAGVAAPINMAPEHAAHPVPIAVMTYDVFEATVDHGDLPECPKALAAEGRFCRVLLHGEALHVFAFSEDLDQPMQAVIEYPLEAIKFPE